MPTRLPPIPVGAVFGDWVVIASGLRGPLGAREVQYCRVRCVCGTEKGRADSILRSGQSMGCGCSRGRALAARGITHGKTGSPIHKLWRSIKYRLKNQRSYEGIRMHARWAADFEAFEDAILALGPKPTEQHSLDRIDVTRGYEPGNIRWADKRTQSMNRTNAVAVRFSEQWSGVAVGQRYERLVVLELTVVSKHGRQWYAARVLCDCGTTKTVDRRQLLRGRTTSCGCRRRENLHRVPSPPTSHGRDGFTGDKTKYGQYITANGVTDNIAGWAKRLGMSPEGVGQRIRMGWDPVKAVTTPPRRR